MNVIDLYDIKNSAVSTQNFAQESRRKDCLLLHCQYPLGEWRSPCEIA